MHYGRSDAAGGSVALTTPPSSRSDEPILVGISPALWSREPALGDRLGPGYQMQRLPACCPDGGCWRMDVVLLATSDIDPEDDFAAAFCGHRGVIVVETRPDCWPEGRPQRAVSFLEAGAGGYVDHYGLAELAATVRAVARRLHPAGHPTQAS